ncbi:MAG: hypothetical protein M0Q38_04300 [Bacteroidales bacterium]|jgi:hypothetical protein|nr:hypothetical protein [Bacteroidales bacterium]
MNPQKLYLLLIICLIAVMNPANAQTIVKSSTGTSNIYESGDNAAAKIGIGLTKPTAKLHIFSSPVNQTLLKIEAIPAGSNTGSIGTVESWCIRNGVYYGIYQTQLSSIIPKNYFQNNVGIGVVDPKYKLDVNGVIGCTGGNATGITIANRDQPFEFTYDDTPCREDSLNDGNKSPYMTTPLTISGGGVQVEGLLDCKNFLATDKLKIKDRANTGSVFMCQDKNGNGVWADTSVFSIINGNVGIGIPNTYGYKLAVNGTAICEEMKIKLKNHWPDYVFNKDYNLPGLQEVDRFIQTNNRLPDVPSAKEVSENGFNVGEMNALLLKKVEELTLYIIALQKEVEQLKTKSTLR